MFNIKNGLVAIVNEIFEDVMKEVETTLRDAEKEAEAILRKAKEEAAKTGAALLSDAKEKSDIEKKKAKSLTEIEVRNKILQAKDELVNITFDEALTRLNDFAQGESYHDYLLNLIQEAAERIGSDALTVYANSKDRKWLADGRFDDLSKKLRVRLTLAKKTENCVGGCIVKTSDGKISYDTTFEKRLQQLKPILRIRVAKILFGEEGMRDFS